MSSRLGVCDFAIECVCVCVRGEYEMFVAERRRVSLRGVTMKPYVPTTFPLFLSISLCNYLCVLTNNKLYSITEKYSSWAFL